MILIIIIGGAAETPPPKPPRELGVSQELLYLRVCALVRVPGDGRVQVRIGDAWLHGVCWRRRANAAWQLAGGDVARGGGGVGADEAAQNLTEEAVRRRRHLREALESRGGLHQRQLQGGGLVLGVPRARRQPKNFFPRPGCSSLRARCFSSPHLFFVSVPPSPGRRRAWHGGRDSFSKV